MDSIILIITISILNVVCFFLGAKIGQKVSKGEEIKMPNPIKAINEYSENKEYQKEQEEFNINMHNIDIYDGTSLGQKEFK